MRLARTLSGVGSARCTGGHALRGITVYQLQWQRCARWGLCAETSGRLAPRRDVDREAIGAVRSATGTCSDGCGRDDGAAAPQGGNRLRTAGCAEAVAFTAALSQNFSDIFNYKYFYENS